MKIGDTIKLYNYVCKITRLVRIKRINKESFVVDYGEDSNFDIKYSFKTKKPMENIKAWNDFEANPEDVEQMKLVNE